MNHLDLRAVAHSNLLLLGFSFEEQLRGATATNAQLRFEPNMFATANGKASDAVLHFLLSTLDPAKAAERFADCWPIYDRQQQRDFRNAVFKWLELLKREGIPSTTDGLLNSGLAAIPADVPVRRSYLDECKGERFERLMCALSTHVLRTVLQRDYADHYKAIYLDFEPGKRNAFQGLLYRTLKIHIAREAERHVQMLQRQALFHEKWREFAGLLAKEYRDIMKLSNEIHHRRWRFEESLDARGKLESYRTAPLPAALLEAERAASLESLRQLWQRVMGPIEACHQSTEGLDDFIAREVNRGLNGKNLKLQSSKDTQHEKGTQFAQEYDECSSSQTTALHKLIRVWRLGFIELNEKMELLQKEGGIEAYASLSSSAATLAKEHVSYLANVRSLKRQLSTQLEEMEASVAKLRESLQQKNGPGISRNTPGLSKAQTKIFPATPVPSFGDSRPLGPATSKKYARAWLAETPSISSEDQVISKRAQTKLRKDNDGDGNVTPAVWRGASKVTFSTKKPEYYSASASWQETTLAAATDSIENTPETTPESFFPRTVTFASDTPDFSNDWDKASDRRTLGEEWQPLVQQTSSLKFSQAESLSSHSVEHKDHHDEEEAESEPENGNLEGSPDLLDQTPVGMDGDDDHPFGDGDSSKRHQHLLEQQQTPMPATPSWEQLINFSTRRSGDDDLLINSTFDMTPRYKLFASEDDEDDARNDAPN